MDRCSQNACACMECGQSNGVALTQRTSGEWQYLCGPCCGRLWQTIVPGSRQKERRSGRKIHIVTCPDCGEERRVASNVMSMIRGGTHSGRCRSCAAKIKAQNNPRRRKPQNCCVDCGKVITPGATRCYPCHVTHIQSRPDCCTQCGAAKKSRAGSLCRSCATKRVWTLGQLDHLRKPPRLCEICGASLSWNARGIICRSCLIEAAGPRAYCCDCGIEIGRGSVRCWECWREHAHANRQRVLCVDCGVEISYGSTRCQPCNFKHRKGSFSGPTDIEGATARALDNLGVNYEIEFSPDSTRWIWDFRIGPILLEVQGTFWHSSWEARRRDEEKAAWAKKHGFVPIEIWGHELRAYDSLRTGAEALIKERVLPLLT